MFLQDLSNIPLGQVPTVIHAAEFPILLNPVLVRSPTYQKFADAHPEVVCTFEEVIGEAGVFEKAIGKTTEVLSVNPPWQLYWPMDSKSILLPSAYILALSFFTLTVRG